MHNFLYTVHSLSVLIGLQLQESPKKILWMCHTRCVHIWVLHFTSPLYDTNASVNAYPNGAIGQKWLLFWMSCRNYWISVLEDTSVIVCDPERQKNADLPAGYCECVPRILKGVYATGTLHTVTSNINFYWNSNYDPIWVKEGTTLTIKGFIHGRLYVILQPILKRNPISHCNLQTFTGKNVTYSIIPSLWISNWWMRSTWSIIFPFSYLKRYTTHNFQNYYWWDWNCLEDDQIL